MSGASDRRASRAGFPYDQSRLIQSLLQNILAIRSKSRTDLDFRSASICSDGRIPVANWHHERRTRYRARPTADNGLSIRRGTSAWALADSMRAGLGDASFWIFTYAGILPLVLVSLATLLTVVSTSPGDSFDGVLWSLALIAAGPAGATAALASRRLIRGAR